MQVERKYAVRVLVTGGAGYIGCHTVRMLSEAGYDVIVYDSLERGHRGAAVSAALIKGNTADEETINRTLLQNRIDAVIHMASYGLVRESVDHPGLYYKKNVIGGLSLLAEAVKTGVEYFIFSSSAAVYGEPAFVPITERHALHPLNPYGETKVVLENALRYYHQAYGLKFITLRYFNAAGASPDGTLGEDHRPETHLIPLALQAAAGRRNHITVYGDDHPTPDGTAVRDYLHVEDLACAHVLALEALVCGLPAGAYNLGTEQGYSVRQVIKTVEKVTGRPVPCKTAPRWTEEPSVLVASSKKAAREMGWQPRYTKLETIIKTAWKWHRENPSGYR